MNGWNLPPGCMDASDADYYNRVNPPQQCQGCKLADYECECCQECGANPDQAHEEWCGLGGNAPLDNMNYDYED